MTYRTIVADPPWHYDDHVRGRSPGWRKRPDKTADWSRRPMPFQTMTVAEICELPVDSLAGSSAGLFLWTTNRYLPDAFAVLDAWGFVYRQTLVWDKAGSASPLSGSVAPNQAEYLLVARRGAHRWTGRIPYSVIRGKRTVHSRKPEVFMDAVEAISPGPYLELFARRQRLGWDTWGDEALAHVELTA